MAGKASKAVAGQEMGGASVLVRLHVPDSIWRVIKARAVLTGLPASTYVVQILEREAKTKKDGI